MSVILYIEDYIENKDKTFNSCEDSESPIGIEIL